MEIHGDSISCVVPPKGIFFNLKLGWGHGGSVTQRCKWITGHALLALLNSPRTAPEKVISRYMGSNKLIINLTDGRF